MPSPKPQPAPPPHIVLLGDSIFDNAAYVAGGPDVVRQLRGLLPEGGRASLLAVDGAVIADVARQLSRLSDESTLLEVSAGGNDALGESSLLHQNVGSVGDALARLAQVQRAFAGRYSAMVDHVCSTGVPVALCTIYDTAFPSPEGEVIATALTLFNDVITRAAFARGLPLVDLRLLCGDPADYANPIEPSVVGGAKIAAAIATLASGAGRDGRSTVIAGLTAGN